MSNLLQLPNELLITSICQKFPGRESQIRVLTTLLAPSFPLSKNIVLHGLEATGKSVVTKSILEELSLPTQADPPIEESPELRYAIVKSAECITGRHLLERTVGAVARALDRRDYNSRCENLAQLVVELGKLLETYRDVHAEELSSTAKFVLVFDGIDKQRDAPATLFPALARLGEIIPNLTIIFIVTYPRPNILHTSGVPHIHFPSYNKAQAIKILSLKPGVLYPPDSTPSEDDDDQEDMERTKQETLAIWTKFCASVWDSLSKHTGNDIVSFRTLCNRLWTPFIQPLLSNTYTTKEFSKLFLSQRSLFQNEKILLPNLISSRFAPATNTDTSTTQSSSNLIKPNKTNGDSPGIEIQLPYYSRILLISAYLCSHNYPRTDILHFSHTSTHRRRKKGGGTALTPGSRKPGTIKHRKINRRLIGAQGFLMERWLAVFWAMCDESNGIGRLSGSKGMNGKRTADIEMGIATLLSLRLVGKMGGAGGDVLDKGVKWRVLVGWEAVRSVARSVGVEMEDFLAE